MKQRKSQKGFRTYSFTEWRRWDQRPKTNKPGIYIIAKSNRNISGKPFNWSKEIVYIGMTASKGGLQGRLHQFHHTINGKPSTHGGATRVLHHYKNNLKIIRSLYVSVMEQDICRDKKDKDAIYGLELFCLAEYISRYRKIPQFNDWAQSPKPRK